MADGAFGLTKELERATAPVWAKVKDHVTPLEWPAQAALIAEINALKRERDAVILAHNYMTPEIFHGVGDYVGDSLGLAKEAAKSKAKVIVQAGVHFMAETSKILSPEKTVLIPDLRAGCSLASSITGADVRLIKQRYPGLPVVTYVNTTADVKAETDICCTSANAVHVVEQAAREWGVDRVILIPDEYLARNVAAQTTSASSPGRVAARCTSASPPTTSPTCARPIRGRKSSPTPSAPKTCWRRPTSPARPRR